MARLQVLLAALCFGTTGTAQALGPGGIDPAAVGAARIAVGGLLLVIVALAAASRRTGAGRARWAPRRVRPDAPRGWSGAGRWAVAPVAAAAVGVAVYQVAFFAAVADTGVAVGTIVALGSAPALAGAGEWLLHGRRPASRWVGATVFATAGVALLALAGGGAAGISPVGVLLAVVAGGSYATYTLSAKRLLDDGHAPESVMAVAFGLGAVLLLPVLAVTGAGWLATAGGLGLAVFLGVVPTALAYVLFARGLRGLTASETATLTLGEPMTAAILGVGVLGEQITGTGALGAALVLGGLVLLALRAPHPAPAAATA
jgi:drug/metabolite transporter, DME family